MAERGRVRWYSPRDGEGILTCECGKEFRFVQTDDSLRLQGGDVVEFRHCTNQALSKPLSNGRNGEKHDESTRYAYDIRVIRRCVDDLLIRKAPLVELFHETVRIALPPVQDNEPVSLPPPAYVGRSQSA